MQLSDIQQNTWIFSLGAWVLVLIGWRVVYRNAVKMATRSESKAIIDHLVKLTNEASENAVDYWSSSPESDASASRNVSRIFTISFGAKMSQIQNFMGILSHRNIKIDYLKLSDIQSSATLRAEGRDITDSEVKLEKCQEIVDDCMAFIEHLYVCFELTHPPHSGNVLIQYYLDHFEPYCFNCRRPYQ
jgi:hypothetical protein